MENDEQGQEKKDKPVKQQMKPEKLSAAKKLRRPKPKAHPRRRPDLFDCLGLVYRRHSKL